MLHYRERDLADRPTHIRTHRHSTDRQHVGKDIHKDKTSKGFWTDTRTHRLSVLQGEGDEDRRMDVHGQTLG